MFISIEGIDGCGKSTVKDTIIDWLKENSGENSVVETRLPGGTEFSETVRGAILNSKERLHPTAELLGMFSTHVETSQKVVIPALEAGKHVVSDRCFISACAYQLQGKKDSLFYHLMRDVKVPDIVFFIDIDYDTAVERQASRGRKDSIESRGPDYYEEVIAAYRRELVMTEGIVMVRIDGTDTIEGVRQQVLDIMKEAVRTVSPMSTIIRDGYLYWVSNVGEKRLELGEVKKVLQFNNYSIFTKTDGSYLVGRRKAVDVGTFYSEEVATKAAWITMLRENYLAYEEYLAATRKVNVME